MKIAILGGGDGAFAAAADLAEKGHESAAGAARPGPSGPTSSPKPRMARAPPYLARKRGAETIAINTRATRLPMGVFPLSRRDRAFAVLRQAHPAVEGAGDALFGALMNADPIILRR